MQSNLNEQNETIQQLKTENQKLIKTIDILDLDLLNAKTKISQIQQTLQKIVGISFPNEFKNDLDYISLTLHLNSEESDQIKFLPFNIENEYRETGKAPTLEEYHNQLLHRLKIEESDKGNYPIEISIKMLNKLKDPIYMNKFSFLSETL